MTFAAPVETKSIRFRARSFVAFTLTPEAPLSEWLESLDRWIGNSPGYFAGRPVVLNLNTLKPEVGQIEALVAELGLRGIRIYAIELDGSTALEANLPPVLIGAKEATAGLLMQADSKGRPEEAGKPEEAGRAEQGKPEDRQPEAPATLMVKTPIRSGQSVFHAHGDVIVLGSVASGSEIVAAGSIHVYGTLRGRASAGVLGHSAARIFCRKNEAELLSVDGWYCTAEEMEPSLRGKAVQAFLEKDTLRIAPFS
ncbi:MAG: septum formation inhibitor MinC [Mesorhizobium sp.]|uniref:septum site-determining protein MinC n=1 Tax=unclassified Mesorhizobium TaxID=325217 RepID=UPI000FC9B74C|nr:MULTISPECIES: septum site-determining protein MinC [unclassified Mesorhizobium]RUV70178.1 septum formation inhibitor MinC [Mesorhizobium sp. M5C.F.Ca.IN.020.14.1.1]RUV31933.1 septum formation inhibitor MinC [Mesorhizobium sp. M5C.F.Ca.IN.020.32.2.1]RUV55819.1 septum formation inhibitor MinC [Mesorhizobium sp. M5C.F.Ca.IN.020.29.1.1]RWD44177.1 MAG: septum formation inhibitor MinC [Mesorhizobium sp.]RWE09996.1 MAG: septum formation inhibitor MinC [Mesorhizobium sp.]